MRDDCQNEVFLICYGLVLVSDLLAWKKVFESCDRLVVRRTDDKMVVTLRELLTKL